MENLKDKNILITGATSGIGRVAAEKLALMGAHVNFTTRDIDKGELTKQEIISRTGNGKVNYYFCDMASLDSVRKCASEFLKDNYKLHILINNAGGWNKRYKKTVDGNETTFQVNHLSPFLLTNLLLDKIIESAPARIINVASKMHFGRIYFEDVNLSSNYIGARAYAQSKLANILFTSALAEKLKGSGVTANSLHPGGIYTHIYDKMNPVTKFFLKSFLKTAHEGADTILYLATSDDVKEQSGKYFANQKEAKPFTNAKDTVATERLWKLSEKMTGLT